MSTLPEPAFYIYDQHMGDPPLMMIQRENPKPDCPGLAAECLGLWTYRQVQELLAQEAE